MPRPDSSTEIPSPRRPHAVMPRVYSAAAEHRPIRHRWRCATELDARGGQPPRTLDAILAALALVAPGEELCVRTKSRPHDLLEALRQRNISATTAELADASWRTRMRRE